MGASLAALALTGSIGLTSTACTSAGGSSGSSHSNSGGSGSDCGYSWNPCQSSGPDSGTSKDNKGSNQPGPSTGPVRWGDWLFGECSISLWPAYVGLNFSDGHLIILASTACVGYQPREIHVHITLQKWWAPGGVGTKSDYHDTGVTLADNTIPPLVILPRDGEPPLSEQHKISGSVVCTPNNLTKAVPYRLRIDIIGVSYRGEPIVTGGFGSAFIVSHWDCA